MAEENATPAAVIENVQKFHDSITDVFEALESFLSAPMENTKAELNALHKAKLDLMTLFAANSFFWIYWCTRGEDPIDHPISGELRRLRKIMTRMAEIEETLKKRALK